MSLSLVSCICGALYKASTVRIGNVDKESTSAAADLCALARSGCIYMRPMPMSVKNFVLAQKGDTGRKFTIGIAYHVDWAAAQLSNATECPSIANSSNTNAQHAIEHLSYTAGDNTSTALGMLSMWR